jgi:exopolyphosphatase/guanosine-5'-triphosphate,3'-diphosphate pyrophosphatase
MEEVRACTGISGSILSESSEAFLSAKGVLSVLPRSGKGLLTFDLGGSTTEFLALEPNGEEPVWSDSAFVGAATITERFLREAPPSVDSVRRAREAVREALREVMNRCGPGMGGSPQNWELAGTAGTVTTLAAMHLRMDRYEPHRINGAMLTSDWLEGLIGHLAGMSLVERRLIPGLEEGREDIILGGALVVHEILRGLDRSRLLVADAGLLEGLLLDLVERECFGSAGLRATLRWRFP